MKQFYNLLKIGMRNLTTSVGICLLALCIISFSVNAEVMDSAGKVHRPFNFQQETPFEAHINFQSDPSGINPPAGYLADFGRAFATSSVIIGDNTYAYGWKLASSGAPFDASNLAANNSTGVGRNRFASVAAYNNATLLDKLSGTLVHFQGDNIRDDSGAASWSGQPRGNELFWEIEIPNGIYEVNIGLGDKGLGNLDSRHSATVEGFSVMPSFAPANQETRVSTIVVAVSDGLLTINGFGGYNSKITHIDITPSIETPVSASLAFAPGIINQIQVSGSTTTFSSTVTGNGAQALGLVIQDNINVGDRTATGSNDWLSLPASAAVGELVFNSNATSLTSGATRANTIIATAKGFKPAVLEADLLVRDALSIDKEIITFTLAQQTAPAIIDNGNFTININVEKGTDLSKLTPEITISENASVSPESGALVDFNNPVEYIVIAQDESLQPWQVIVTVDDSIPNCSPVSILACEDILTTLPVNFDFNGVVANTLIDANGNGTGFTAALEHSEARRSGDIPISNINVNGYEPSLLNVTNGALEIVSQGGINYLNPPPANNNNNQINTLGVGLQNIVAPLILESTLLNITTGANSAQAGIWFGIDEDNFVKLNVNANNVELRREIDGLSVNGASSQDQIQLDNVGVAGQNVVLRMVIDPLQNSITAFYAVNGGQFIQLTKSGLSQMQLPQLYLTGRNLNSTTTGVTFAGVYATHRNGSQFTAKFDSFSATSEIKDLALSFEPASLEFSGVAGEEIAPQTATLSTNGESPTFSLIDDPNSSWLILPTNPEFGILEFGIQSGLPAGSYSTTVFATSDDSAYTNAQLEISLEISPEQGISDQNDISTFIVEGNTGAPVINLDAHLISLEVENGIDRSALAPTITVSEGATVTPLSGVVQDFTNPVIYTVTAEIGSAQEWTVEITEAEQAGFALIEDFDTYGTGNLHQISAGAWSKEGANDAVIPVINQGLTPNTSYSLDFSRGAQTHDFETLINNPIDLVAGQAFYFSTVFNVTNLGVNTTDRIRSAVRVDGGANNAQWIRQQIAHDTDNTLMARIGLGGAGSDNGNISILPNQILQFVTRGIWDGANTISYSWTIDPQLDADENIWLPAGTHTVQSAPELGRIFISSNGNNNGKLGPVRLATNYTTVVTEKALPEQEICAPISILPCEDIAVSLPFSLDFSGSQGGLADTGFTMVDNPSNRIAADGAVSFTQVPGYEPSRINISGGTLRLNAGNGIAYVTNGTATGQSSDVNSQINTLGVGFDATASGNFNIRTSVINPYRDNTANSEQGGIWFGLNEDNFVKVVTVNSGQVEIRSEVNGQSITADGILTEVIANLHTSTVGLRLYVDAKNSLLTAFYSLNEGNEIEVGSLPLPASFIAGNPLYEGKSFAGVFTTKRREATAMVQYTFQDFAISPEDTGAPYFANVNIADGAVSVPLESFQITVDVIAPTNYELNKTTLEDNVNLFERTAFGDIAVGTNANDTGGGDAITLSLKDGVTLKENTTYIFRLADGIEANRIGDLTDRLAFTSFESSFTTGEAAYQPPTFRDLTGVEFDQVKGQSLGEGTDGELFSSLVIGPDGKLYASTIGDFSSDGKIKRWDMEADGTLTNLEVLSPALQGSPHPVTGANNNNTRLIIGLVFDPTSTADNLIAYVTHSVASETSGPEWDGKITRLSGENLQNVEDIVIHLPRSAKDHLSNSITFDKNGVMYISQGSNTAGGDPDAAWGFRKERLLSGAILKIELNKLPEGSPLDVYTTDNISVINSASASSVTMSDGTYNPYSINSPVTIFATGVRNAYDLVWHSNGWLYVPTNGTAGNNRQGFENSSPNSPSTADYPLARRIDGLTSIPSVPRNYGEITQKDWLFKTKGGSYHGHPNPYRGEFVLNHGGLPYSGVPGQETDSYVDVTHYPNTLGPDPNYRQPAFDFGFNKSPNGVLEYKSTAFGGKLQGLLMVVRFSGQDDVFVLDPGANGDITETFANIPGLGGFDDPLDVVEDVKTGNLYVADYDRGGGGLPRLALLRAKVQAITGPIIALTPNEITGDAITLSDTPFTKQIQITNKGNAALTNIEVTVNGVDAGDFTVSNLPASIAPQEMATFEVFFSPKSNGPKNASLTVTATDAEQMTVALNGLGKSGTGGDKEPSLQWVLDTQLGQGVVNVGDVTPSTNKLDFSDGNTYNNLHGDELSIQQFIRAASGEVTLEVLSVFGPEENNPVTAFGWYSSGNAASTNQVFTVSNAIAGNGQTLNPEISGVTSFDPGTESFGFFSRWPFFNNRILYSEDALNTFTGAIPHHVRVYALPGEENAYIIATEEHVSGFDYQDVVVIARNLKPASEAFAGCNPISTLACDALEVSLPFNLDFSGDEGGLSNTGFTMVDNPSARIAVDGAISLPEVPGYEPGRISFSNGKMILNAANGISFVKNGTATGTSTNVNSQINSLGVGINAGMFENFSIKTSVLNPYSDNTNNSEQAGLWFGLNEDNFIKLIIANDGRVELRNEVNAVSNDSESIRGAVIPNYNSANINLRLYVDIINKQFIGYYAVNGGVETLVGNFPIPPSFIAGNSAYGNLSFAGIMATKRNELNATVNYTFENFELISNTSALTFEPVNINYSDVATAAPAGYNKDSGSPFGDRDNGYSYGWIDAVTNTPVDVTLSSRNRAQTGIDIFKNTLIHMQYGDVSTDASTGYLADAKWEIEVPNGSYRVTVGVGDPNVDSPANNIPRHTINAEGLPVISQFVPTGNSGSPSRFTTATTQITVNDGRLTIDPIGGFNTKINTINIVQVAPSDVPYFTGVNPVNGSTEVAVNGFQIAVEIVVPNGYELDKTTTSNAHIFEITPNGEVLVPTNTNDTGGGDAIILTPLNPLKENTNYVLRMPSTIEANRVGDINDRLSFQPLESRFTTGEEDITGNQPGRDLTGITFSQVRGAALGERVQNERFSSMQVGPDGKLYASTIGDFQSDGKIFRWNMAADGTLTNLQVISPELNGAVNPVNGSPQNNDVRLIIGFRFDPASTANNLIAYITHSKSSESDGPEWDGVLTRLSGPNLENVQDLIIHLPRSKKDHLTNSIAFDLNGDMFISQGSNTAGGQPDAAWAFRPERLLSGAILKVELDKLPGNLPLDAFTTDDIAVINNAPANSITMSNGTYNPYAINSPLTIFATGVRNAYDLLWHSNGWLYVPTNGTAGNNSNSPNSPATTDYPLARRIDGRTTIPAAPALFGGNTQKDWLFKTKGGSYHGHPNPYRGEFVLNHGGTSYSGLPGQLREPFKDVTKYASSVAPDLNYRQPAFDFDFNKSPNGVIEYKSDAFGGKLKGLIMVVQFSGQDNLLLLDPGTNGDIAYNYNSIPGLGGFDDPIEVVEDPATGNIYVSEYDRDGSSLPQLTLLRASDPAQPGALIATTPNELIFETTVNTKGKQTDEKTVVVNNTGTETLEITEASITGEFADQFEAISPAGAQSIAVGESLTYTITYAPDLNQNNIGYQSAQLVIASNDKDNEEFEIGLFALKKKGFEGGEEPDLQDVVDALGIGIDVGWNSLANGVDPEPIGDEVEVERWVKLNAQSPVRITPVGRYSPAETLPFGWYVNNGEVVTNEIGVLQEGLQNAQTLFPPMVSGEASVDFDPQGMVFGFYVESKSFERINYTEDVLNNPSGVAHRVRTYPNKDRSGNLIPNSYLISFEDASNGDYQDYMFIMDNVVPFDEALLAFGFNRESMDFTASVNDENVAKQQVTLTATGPVTTAETTFDATENWVILPENFDFDTPFDIGVDITGLAIGNYEALVTASAPNYSGASFTVNLVVTNEVVYVYQFNFQSPDDIEVSPDGYINDIGASFGAKNTDLGTIQYGWVLPNTDTPANAGVNARNRNTGTNDDALLKTFNILGHRDAAQYPLRDWKVNLPNGSYSVNISAGEDSFRDSNHVLDVNGITVLDFDQENNNPQNLINAQGTRLVEVTDGTMRLSLNPRGVNAKPNYIRIAPINIALLPPTITATLDGLMFEEDLYRGMVNVTLSAEDRSGSGSIVRIDYSVDGAPVTNYTEAFAVTQIGEHTIVIEAEDANGNIAAKTITFTIEEPSGALLYMENMTKIPGTQRGFPADNYYTFYRIGNPNTTGVAPNVALTHDTNIMRLNNTGTGALIISNIQISDTRDYSYTIVSSGETVTLPFSIAPGASRDLQLRITASTTNGRSALFKESITITSNADNSRETVATLNGGFAPQPEGSDEITAQQVFDAFGFTSSMRSIVNDNGTITPPNSESTRPSSNFPKAENIDAGYEGDLILSSNFVQADRSKPVVGMQLSALHGKGADNGRFISATGTGTVGGIDFRHTNSYYQTLLPKRGTQINADLANSINGPFRIAIANYLSSGGNDINGTRPDLLGIRVFKAKDQDGNIIPNEYIVLQDFIQGGCGAGSANCDWNDNTFYFINVRPEAVPTALPIEELLVNVGESFTNDVNLFFNKGYAGNKLTYKAVLANGSALPQWISIDETGRLAGTAPDDADASYTLTVTATDLNGLTVSQNAVINVNRNPVALAAANVQEGQAPLEVSFTGENSTDESGLLTYLWDFGDGETSEEINPTHTYGQLGSYTATLKVTDEGGLSSTASLAIIVTENTAPVALVSANVQEGQAPLEVNFIGDASNDDLGIVSYAWDFGNGETSEEMNPSFIYTEIGEYIASLTVTDAKGLTGTASLTINVSGNEAPIAIASADAPEGKVAHTVNFTGSASTDDVEIASYAWDFGNGSTADIPNPQFIYEEEGNFEVTLTVTDNKGVSTTSDTLLISILPSNTPPVAIAEADVTFGPSPLLVQFTGSNSQDDTEVVNYFWNFGNGQTSSEVNPSVIFNQEGQFTVILVVEDKEGQFGVANLTINVGADNTAPVAVIDGGPFMGNTPLDVVFIGENSLDDKGIVNYVWDFGDGSFSSEINPTHRYNNAGTYIVELTVYDAENLQDVARTAVQVNSTGGGVIAPVAVANANITQGTSPLTVNFNGSGSSDDTGTIASYRWTLNEVTLSTATNFDYIFEDAGSYDIILTVTDADGLTDSDAVTIVVETENAAPVAAIQVDKTTGQTPLIVAFNAAGSSDDKAITSYNWTIGGNSVSTLASFDYTFTQPGTYQVSLEVTDAEGLTDTDVINITVQQSEPDPDFALRINAGGPETVYNGKTFVADRNFVGGKTYLNAAAPVSTMFQTERSSDPRFFNYALPVPNGTYMVNLYFAEIYWGATGGGPGGNRKRVFDVRANGTLVIDNYDINADVGPQTEVVKSFEVTVTDGELRLNFSALGNVGGIDQPKLSGLEVLTKAVINQAPQAVASATPLNGRAPLEVAFTGSNSTDDVAIANYLWTFKDGSTSTEQNPVFIFTEVGEYSIELMVEDEQGLTDTASVTVSVSTQNVAPVAVAIATPISGTAPLQVNFNGSNSTDDYGISTYVWNFGDGSTATTQNVSHTYVAEGTYLASLTVTDDEGLINTSAPIEITVNESGTPEGVAFYLNTGSSANVDFEGRTFIGDISTPNLYNSPHTYTNQGASNFPLYQTERGSAANLETLSFSIPVPNGTYRVQTYHNELWWGRGRAGGAGKRVFDILIENVLVKDNFDVFTESRNNPIRLDFNSIVVIDGVLNIDLPASVDRSTISGIAIESMTNKNPVAIASATPQAGTAPLIVSFDGSASTDDGRVTSYLWEFEPGVTATESKPVYTFRTAGSYPVTLTVKDAQGLSDQTTVTIEVSAAPPSNDVAVYINAGSASSASLDGHVFIGDINMPNIHNSRYTYADAGASSIALYQSERGPDANLGTLNYSIPVPNGTYTVSTYHNEMWWGKKGGAAGPRKRIFDILIEGNLVKDDFDIFREFDNRPTKLSFYNITVTDGILNISLPSSVDRSSIAGIAIEGSSQNEAPLAVANATPKVGTAPFNATFSSSGSKDDKGIVSYRWDFKDGSISTLQNPTHEFVNAGLYTVSLTVTDGEGLSNVAEILIEAQGCSVVPQPWTSADIGAVAATGSTCYYNGQFNVSASGADIWGSRDEFHYVYRSLTGDGEIIARVTGLTKTDNWAKAGVMMRESAAAGSKQAFMHVSPDPTYKGGTTNYGYSFQTRNSTNGSSSGNTPLVLPNSGLPYYVRMVRSGNTFTGYISKTNGNWTQVSTVTISMNAEILVGLATTSHKDGIITKGIYDNVSVTGSNQASAITAAPMTGEAPLNVEFNGTDSRRNIDVSLSYFWEFQDGTTSDEVNPEHVFEAAGIYPVSLTVKRGKEILYQSTVEITVDGAEQNAINMGDDTFEVFSSRLYPNPAVSQVTLEVSNNIKSITKVMIFDVRGRLVIELDANKFKNGNRYTFDVESLEAGVYMLSISGDDGIVEQKRLIIKD